MVKQMAHLSSARTPAKREEYFLIRQDNDLPAIPVRVKFNAAGHEVSAETPNREGDLNISNHFWFNAKNNLPGDRIEKLSKRAFSKALSSFKKQAGNNVIALPLPGNSPA